MTDPAEDTKAKLETTSLEASVILCSICLDAIIDDVDRSRVKLHCGHEFHLDCIGSAFNMKGVMQCPNCRKVEKGRWLYASARSTRSISEIRMEDWALHDDQYGLNYPEIPLNIHWCPFSGLARVHSAFEALESSPPGYHNLHRHHSIYPEHGAIAYFRPIPSASPNASDTIEDPNFSYQWNGVTISHVFPHGVRHPHLLSANNTHASSTDQAPVAPGTLRSARGDFGAMSRSGPYMHPFLYGHGNRSHERLQPPTIHHPHPPNNPLGMPRFHGRRSSPSPPVPTNSVSDGNGGFLIFPSQSSVAPISHETENSLQAALSSDRNTGWLSFHNGGSSHGHW